MEFMEFGILYSKLDMWYSSLYGRRDMWQHYVHEEWHEIQRPAQKDRRIVQQIDNGYIKSTFLTPSGGLFLICR
jgi:hypothetical protein